MDSAEGLVMVMLIRAATPLLVLLAYSGAVFSAGFCLGYLVHGWVVRCARDVR